jgi:DNA polymerase-1
MKRVLMKMAPDLKYDILTLVDEPFSKTLGEAEKLERARSAFQNLESTENEDSLYDYEKIIGFGKYSSYLLTGYSCDSAWGTPTMSATQLFWGFYDLDYTSHNKGVLLPHLHKLLERVQDPYVLYDWGKIITTPREALSPLVRLESSGLVTAVDIENNPTTNTIMRIGLSFQGGAVSLPWDEYESGQWGHVPALESLPLGESCAQFIRAILANPNITKVGHNVWHDINHLRARGFTVEGKFEDTLVQHATLYPDAPHNLGFVSAYANGTPPWKKDFKAGTEDKGLDVFVKRDPQELAVYNAKDCIATIRAWHVLQDELENTTRGQETYQEGLKKSAIAARMGDIGVAWDYEAAEKHKVRLTETLGKIQTSLNTLSGRDLNPNSTKQLVEYFVRDKGVVPTVFTGKGAPSMNDNALALLRPDKDPSIAHVAHGILAYRENAKLLGSYLKNIKVARDGRVHPEWKTWGAKTGRWACTNPALQTIPKIMRDLYRAPPGKFLIYPDQSQLELRTMAGLSKDLPAIQTFQKGIRVHTKNAQDIFRLGNAMPTEKQETFGKTAVYTMNYGGTPKTVWTRLRTMGEDVSLEFCEQLFESWFAAHPALKKYLDETYRFVDENLYFELPISGRRLQWWQKPTKQETANRPNQATGADIMDRALLILSEDIDWEDTVIIGQIHDAFLIETSDVLGTCEKIEKAMSYDWDIEIDGETHSLPFRCGFECSAKGGNWLTMTKYKTLADVRAAAEKGAFE